ncbi:unnamed protein product [Ixodes persulcatus]
MQSIHFNCFLTYCTTWSDLACAQSRLRRQPVRAGHVPAPSPYAANSLPKLLSMDMVFIETLLAQSGYFSAPMSAPILLCQLFQRAHMVSRSLVNKANLVSVYSMVSYPAVSSRQQRYEHYSNLANSR